MMKREADNCGIKLSDVGRAMLKDYIDINSEEYVQVFKRYKLGVGGILELEEKSSKKTRNLKKIYSKTITSSRHPSGKVS